MSFLYPLFLAGLAAVSIPVVLHLIQRHTRKQQVFSSLMFLSASRPRYKSRSRLDHILLLVLRCLILCLLALAFARPFLQDESRLVQDASGRRVVLLVDVSGSMRQAGVWEKAQATIQTVIDEVKVTDRLCVMTFARETDTLIGFEQWQNLEVGQRTAFATDRVGSAAPGWEQTRLDQALIAATRAIEEDEVNQEAVAITEQEVILVSDMQEGSQLELLHTYQWPEGISLRIESVEADKSTNASMHLVAGGRERKAAGTDVNTRLRVSNNSGATTEQFLIGWDKRTVGDDSPGSVDVYAPPGESIVVAIPTAVTEQTEVGSEDPGYSVVLTGDVHDFDNTLYVAPPVERVVNILYVGDDDAADPKGNLFYFLKVFQPGPLFKPHIITKKTSDSLAELDRQSIYLAVIAGEISEVSKSWWADYFEAGKTALLVLREGEGGRTLNELLGEDRVASTEARIDDYAMLGEIDFEHPIMKPFDDPRFSDFTHIHFWTYRRLTIPESMSHQTLARYDNDDPAWVSFALGKGTLLVWTSGWEPGDSQLSRSSKFVPLMYSILEHKGSVQPEHTQYYVGDRIDIPEQVFAESDHVQIRKPDNSMIQLESEKQRYFRPNMPGLYTLEGKDTKQQFAVNLHPDESRTDVLSIDILDQYGVATTAASAAALNENAEMKQRKNYAALESKQKLWRWALMSALIILIIEICVAGRPRPVEAQGV